MLGVGRRELGGEGRTGEVGFRGMGAEEFELEEGEAAVGYGREAGDDGDDDEFVDPDAFTYIDEKLQDVLGHFRKDFEGGVFAENLGAKYGGYGSFLPTYQRSPSVLSQSRSPVVPPNQNSASRSPYISVESAQQNPFVTTSSSASRGYTPALNSSRKNSYCHSTPNEKDANLPQQMLNRAVNGTEQKTLKVRIKVGNDKSLARNTASIYSGLGLDISPSSSMDDSLDGSAGTSEPQLLPDESPNTILQIMTHLSIPGGFLHSPLAGNVLELREKPKPTLRKHKKLAFHNTSTDPHREWSGTTPGARDIKDQMPKKLKFNEKKEHFFDLKSSKFIDHNTTDLNKEMQLELQDLSDAIGSTLLPRGIKTEQHCVEESAKCAGGILDRLKEIKSGLLNGQISGKASLSEVDNDSHLKGKANANASEVENALEEQSTSNNKEPFLDLRKHKKEHAFFGKAKYDLDNPNDQSLTNDMQVVRPFKTTSQEQVKEKAVWVKDEPSEDKRKEMGTLTNATSMDIIRKTVGGNSSGTVKGKKKISSLQANPSEKKVKIKPRKELSSDITRKSYDDNAVMENRVGLTDLHHKDKGVKSEKNTVSSRKTDKDRPGGGNDGSDKVSPMFVDEPAPMPAACKTETIEASVTVPAPPFIYIKEEWVGCDKCGKWRLLPQGMNPDTFPKKWRCSMLNWLPGMNSCRISEDTTTNAQLAITNTRRAISIAPTPENSINPDGRHDISTSGISTATTLPTFEDNIQPITSTGKWKNGSNVGANMTNNLNLAEMSKCSKKLQAPRTSRNLDDVDCNTAVHGTLEREFVEPGFKLSDIDVEKQIAKRKEKRERLESSDKGESVGKGYKHSKLKGGLGVDHDNLRASKQVKKEFNDPVKHQHSEIEVGKNSPLAKATRQISHKRSALSTGMGMYDSKTGASSSSKRIHDEDQVLTDGGIKTLDAERSDQPDLSIKKRKVKQRQLSQHGPEAPTSNQHVFPKPDIKEALSESEATKEKPRLELKVSKTDDHRKVAHARDPIAGVDNDSVEKECLSERCQENIHSQPLLLSESSGKRNMSYAQACTAATSSSSKVSTSHKSKVDFQETRGSPVESVSSSPLRASDKNQLDQPRRYLHAAGENVYYQESGKSGSSCSKEKYDVGSDSDQAKANVVGFFIEDVNHHDLMNRDTRKDKQKLLTTRDLKDKCSGLGQNDGQLNSLMEQKVDAHGPPLHANNDHKKPPSHQNEKMLLHFCSNQSDHPMLTSGKDPVQVKPDLENKDLKIAPSPVKGSKQQPSVNSTAKCDPSNMEKQLKKTVVTNGAQHNNIKQTTLNGDMSCPINASSVLKEARDLKHLSNRLKEKGDDLESTSMCFEAVLKFLHVASLYEPPSVDILKQGDATHAMHMYSQTGKLCGFCAREFERLKKMANAALAYKCVEVAYMKAAFYKHSGAIRDLHALQVAPLMVPPAESPSSSASDVDNFNNQSTFVKAVSAKGVNSPLIASNHISRTNHHLVGLLAYAEETNFAFEATRKSRIAFSSYIAGTGKDQPDDIAFVREALDSNFHNVKGLLQLIRHAVETINHDSVK